ncbi:MAG: Crp/Fnr family transcriptional regulator [Bacteroidota bacterium]
MGLIRINGANYDNIETLAKHCKCDDMGGNHCPKAFLKLNEEETDFLFQNRRKITYNPGELIIKQDSLPTHIICIESGFIKQYVETEGGKNLIFKVLSSPNTIGFSDILTHSPFKYTTAAVTKTTVCLIPVDDLIKIMKNNPAVSMAILEYTNDINQELIQTIINYTQKNMYQKVATLILFLKKNMFSDKLFTIPFTRQELADMCSITKESLIRILKEFKDSEYIRVNINEIEILNESALEKMSK